MAQCTFHGRWHTVSA